MFEILQIEFKPKKQIFYALYLLKYKKSYILNDYFEADHIRKGKACECKKFYTKENVEKWINGLKNKTIAEPLKKEKKASAKKISKILCFIFSKNK